MEIRRIIWILLVFSVLLVSCQTMESTSVKELPASSEGGQDQPAASPQTSDPTPDTVDPIEDIPAPKRGEEYMLSRALADLTQRLDMPEDEIQVVSVEAVEWSDSSLGCPSEGMDYAQVITPGYEIILQADGAEYRYHSDKEHFMVLCGEGNTPELLLIPIQPGEKIQDGSPWMPVE